MPRQGRRRVQDLGRGGVFGQYRGLAEEFGPDRISDAPISEAATLGASVGAAMMGTRPVVEMRFSDFALCAVDELVNQAAKARFMFGGQTRVPMPGDSATVSISLEYDSATEVDEVCSRAAKLGGAPTVPSRFVQRLAYGFELKKPSKDN